MGFRLKHKRSLGDCTEVYSMSFSAGMTVHEFIDAVLKKKEWGFVSFDNVKGCIEYNYGKITNGNINKFMDYQIVAGSANGGWTRMDYRLVIEPSKSVEPEKKAGNAAEGMTEKNIRKELRKRNISVELHISENDTTPVRTPGVIGICVTKNNNLMVYMVNEKGRLYNTSVHTDRQTANDRVLQRILAAYA